jgi:hypothetical protein
MEAGKKQRKFAREVATGIINPGQLIHNFFKKDG